MSTHILADIERVCDTVGIIDRGRMVTIARQTDLLTQYAVPAFEIESVPDTAAQLAVWAQSLRPLPWVESVAVRDATARIVVRDVAVAQRELLASAAQSGLALTRYEMVRPSLEDVFLRLVGAAERAA